MKKVLVHLVPMGFLSIGAYAIIHGLEGWGWAFFLTVITHSLAINAQES